MAPRLLRSTGWLFDRVLGAELNGPLGAPVGIFRVLTVTAMILAVAADLTALGWASRPIDTSVLGSALIGAWRGVFSAI